MSRTSEGKEPLERLDYEDASTRALELREEAERFLGLATDIATAALEGREPMTGDRAAVALTSSGFALVTAVLEVAARLELLELDAELAREEASE